MGVCMASILGWQAVGLARFEIVESAAFIFWSMRLIEIQG